LFHTYYLRRCCVNVSERPTDSTAKEIADRHLSSWINNIQNDTAATEEQTIRYWNVTTVYTTAIRSTTFAIRCFLSDWRCGCGIELTCWLAAICCRALMVLHFIIVCSVSVMRLMILVLWRMSRPKIVNIAPCTRRPGHKCIPVILDPHCAFLTPRGILLQHDQVMLKSYSFYSFYLPYSAVYLRIQKWKNCWNRSTFAKVIVKIKVAHILWPVV